MNYSVKPDEQSQACLSYAMAKNSLNLLNIFVKREPNKFICFAERRKCLMYMNPFFQPGHGIKKIIVYIRDI
jgi:hypothetical protein